VRGEELVALVVFTLFILAGAVVLAMAMQSRRRIREMEHRERLAMIDRGLVPPPEANPVEFERHLNRMSDYYGRMPPSNSSIRQRNAGVIFIGLGMGFLILIAFAANEPEVAFGVGGAFAALGFAFLVNSWMAGGRDDYFTRATYDRMPPRPAAPPREPPYNGPA
jgi:hypothetical protein